MSAGRLLTMAVCLATISGCANVSTDPREGGFFGGVSGISGGAYDARLREREERLEQLRKTQTGLEAETGRLEATRAATHKEVEAERERLKKLDADVAVLDKKVEALSAEQGQDDARVRELQSRLDRLKGDLRQQGSALDALEGSGLGDSEADLRRMQLEEQRRALQREYELLMQMQLELAR